MFIVRPHPMVLDDLMSRFRYASRELFNHHFRVPDPYNNDGWLLEGRFSQVEAVLFEQLVAAPAALPSVTWGTHQPAIHVGLRHGDFAPIMVNRETDSGYWDFPIKEVTRDAQLSFVRFFDWDLLAVRDNQYVRVVIDAWPQHPEGAGKHALIEAQYVVFRGA
jgi:hypothetical protein